MYEPARIELIRLADGALIESLIWDEQTSGLPTWRWSAPALIADDPAWPGGYEWRRHDSTGLPPLRLPADGSSTDWA